MKRYIIFLIMLGVVEISLALYLTFWREDFWQAVGDKQSLDFIKQLSIFTVVALVIGLVSGLSGYILNLTAIRWREILNTKAFTIQDSRIENFNQRQQDDCMQYPDLFLSLIFGSAKALVYIVVFSVSLLLSFDWWLLVIILLYSGVGTVLTRYIAYPLIHLNYEQQRAEASYRNTLSIANFGDCVRIMLGMAKKQKHLTYFQQFYGQVGVVLPLIIVAPIYFTTGMTLGSLMRFNSLGSTILDNVSYPINVFAMINKLLSCKRRLKEAGII